MKYYCNPLNIPYKYQLFQKENKVFASREAADPSLVRFKGNYLLFPSMTAGFFSSVNLVDWEFHKLPANIPVYDYAPDVRALGEYLVFSASKLQDNCSFYRTKDPMSGDFERIEGSFPFFDPNLFVDDDGRVYFYWGCSNSSPIYGVELDAETLQPAGEKRELIWARESAHGFERTGEDHVAPKTPEMIESAVLGIVKSYFGVSSIEEAPAEAIAMIRKATGNDSYIEGAWMTKRQGVYYLQYAATGTEYNVYNDSVYIATSPLGPFEPAKNNPFSYKPGGFIRGAGHGSTLEDAEGNWWHAATMQVSINHNFERRLGLWRAGFDRDGELFCDQRYGDWPMRMGQSPWEPPEWMPLSYGKNVAVSSGTGAERITDENVRTFWKADSNEPGQWAEVDLGKSYDVRAIQINFADDMLTLEPDSSWEFHGDTDKRIIDESRHATRWILEGSMDGKSYFTIEDKSTVYSDLSHDFIVRDDGIQCRYIKLTVIELPFGQNACVSGLRVFGKSDGSPPPKTQNLKIDLLNDLDIRVRWDSDVATGHNILWGYAPDKLYHSYMVFGKSEQVIGALIKDQPIFIRVDSFNECGISEGITQKI